ncbi:MAG: OB-fold nucleic acid binding domain-containing protein, partial [Lachnospiraceae bacterium]
ALEKAIQTGQAEQKNRASGQESLFGGDDEEVEIPLPDVPEWEEPVKLQFEKEVLGVYLSGHPLEAYQDIIRNRCTAFSTDFMLDEETGESKAENGSRVTVGGIVTEKTLKYTKTNQTMAFVTIEDLMGTVEALVFPKTFEKYRDLLETDRKVLIEGRVSSEDERAGKLIADKVMDFNDVPREMWLAFPTMEDFKKTEREIRELLETAEPGSDRVFIFIRKGKNYREETLRRTILLGENVPHVFRDLIGAENVKMRISKR